MSDPILDLLAAPPSPPLSVDEDAVRVGGRRRLRRRAVGRAVGVSGLLAASALAVATLGSGLGNRPLPPAGGSSTTQSTTVTSAELFDGAYAVEIVPGVASGPSTVNFYTVVQGKRTRVDTARASADGVVMRSAGDGVLLGVAPARMSRSLSISPDAKDGSQGDQAALLGTDYQAVALKFDRPDDVATYKDTVWMDATGPSAVRDSRGTEVPSVALTATDTFFIAREAKTMGVFTADGGSLKPIPTGSGSTTFGYGQKEGDVPWQWRTVTVLPKGARSIDFTWSRTDAHSPVSLHTLPGTGEVVATADATSTGELSPLVTRVSWTDSAGRDHTDKVD